jgi:transcriptional regulator with XRE-family HTH domain
MPPEFWTADRFRGAFASRNIGKVLRAFRTDERHQQTYGDAGISQELLGSWLGMTQAQMSRLERGVSTKDSLGKLIEWAQILSIPADLLWFDLPGQQRQNPGQKPLSHTRVREQKRVKRIELAAARKAAGLTQEQLAEILHVDTSSVNRWEAGAGSPLPYLRPKLANVIGVSREHLTQLLTREYSIGTEVAQPDVGASIRPTPPSSPMRTLQALEIITSDDASTLDVAVECLNGLVFHYSEKLSVSSPVENYNDLLKVRSHTSSLLKKASSTTSVRSELVVAAGWLSNLLAITTSYMGDHGAALIWCIDAERRSHESGNRNIAGWATLTRAMIAYYQGQTNRSVDVANAGQKVAPMGTTVHAKLAAHEMRALAMLGDAEGMSEARRRATKALAALSSDVSTTGVFSIALAEDPPYTATSLLHSKRFQEAATVTKGVIQAAYPTDAHNRNRKSSSYARTLLILGLAKTGLGHADEAAAAGRAALESGNLVWPTFVLAGKLNQSLMHEYKDAPEVADYHALYLEMANRMSSDAHPADQTLERAGKWND